jgi:hypothetical protein
VKSGANKNTMNIKAKEYRKTLNTSYQKYKEVCCHWILYGQNRLFYGNPI